MTPEDLNTAFALAGQAVTTTALAAGRDTEALRTIRKEQMLRMTPEKLWLWGIMGGVHLALNNPQIALDAIIILNSAAERLKVIEEAEKASLED